MSKIIEFSKQDHALQEFGLITEEQKMELTACINEVNIVLDKYKAELFASCPEVEMKVGDQILKFGVPISFGIRKKKI